MGYSFTWLCCVCCSCHRLHNSGRSVWFQSLSRKQCKSWNSLPTAPNSLHPAQLTACRVQLGQQTCWQPPLPSFPIDLAGVVFNLNYSIVLLGLSLALCLCLAKDACLWGHAHTLQLARFLSWKVPCTANLDCFRFTSEAKFSKTH